MLELDILLEFFMRQHYPHLSPEQLHAFDQLLDYSDNALWEEVNNQNLSDEHTKCVLELLRDGMS